MFEKNGICSAFEILHKVCLKKGNTGDGAHANKMKSRRSKPNESKKYFI